LGIPQDNVKDCLACAAHKLQEGNWRECYQLIEDMKIWRLQAENKQDLLKILKEKIKEAGLLSHIYLTQMHYESYSLPILSELFDLSPASLTRILSKVPLSCATHCRK
jgi:translation initiation factor 3 subunit C